MEQLFLSRRNLQTLLNKLDRVAGGDSSECSLLKYKNPDDPFVQTIDEVKVTAVEDDVYYTTRPAGIVHPADDPN